MRLGPYEVYLVADNDQVLPEVEFEDGQTIASAEPGATYHVLVNIYRDASGKFPAKFLRFGLYVDGVDVQYWKRVDLSNEKLLPSHPALPVSSRFWGFKKNLTEMLSFTFSVPKTSTSSSAVVPQSSGADNFGTIRLVVYEAQVTTGVYENRSGYGEAPEQRTIGESAKFWQQASVTTTAGKPLRLDHEKFAPLPRWSNVSKVPLETLVLRYHTLSMIDFLKEFRHRLVPDGAAGAAGRGASGDPGCNGEVFDLTGDDDDRATGSAHEQGRDGNSSSDGRGNLETTEQRSAVSRPHGSLDSQDGDNLRDTEGSHKRRRLDATYSGGDGSGEAAATAVGVAGSSSSTNGSGGDGGGGGGCGIVEESEEPIDEEISYVVRRKEVTVLDLSEDL